MTDATPMLLAHAANIDFDAISSDDWSRWIDSLPLEEFIALIRINDEGAAPDVAAAPDAAPLEPHGDLWETYVADGDYPLPDEELVWVMFKDGETMGPNRTDAFLWGGTGYAEIISYARAVPGTVLPPD